MLSVTQLTGFGGRRAASVIWHCDFDTDDVYELDVADFSTVRSAGSPSSTPRGIGGNASTIWHCDRTADDVYELDTADFSTVRSASSPSSFPSGIGG